MFEAYAEGIAAAWARQANAFALAEQERPPVLIFCNPFIAFGMRPGSLPHDYFQNPESMTRHQLAVTMARMEQIHDDFVPYLVPQYGTGVLASAFGAKIRYVEGSDPAVERPCITSLDDIDRLELPDPRRDGLMPLVLDTIDCMKAASDLPVGLTDLQGTLDTCALLCGHERLFLWMYDAPDKVHRLFDIVTQALISWLVEQKKHIGEPLGSSYCQLLCIPEGFGACLAEDDAVSLSPRLYREFCVPYNARVFAALGGGMIHFCGNATHQIDNFSRTEGLKGFHIIPMGNLNILATMQQRLGDRFVIAAAEFMPFDPLSYYRQLLSILKPRGLLLVPYIVETIALDHGQYVPVQRNILETARQVLAAVEQVYGELRP